jgi:hypothetical protein
MIRKNMDRALDPGLNQESTLPRGETEERERTDGRCRAGMKSLSFAFSRNEAMGVPISPKPTTATFFILILPRLPGAPPAAPATSWVMRRETKMGYTFARLS